MVKSLMGRNKRSGDAPAGRGSRLPGSVLLLLLTTAGCDSPAGPDSRTDPFAAEGPMVVRQGEVAAYSVRILDEEAPIPQLTWSLLPSSGGFITPEGRFVGYDPGTVRIVASAGDFGDTLEVSIAPRDGPTGGYSVEGRGEVANRLTSDLWLFGDVAYTGTWGFAGPDPPMEPGNRVFVWDVSSPASIRLVDSVAVAARTVNDVMIRDDGALAVLTHEGSPPNDGSPPNGITLLDLTDPFDPTVITRFTDRLTLGVHNIWIEGDFVYAVSNGTEPASGSGLQIIDVSNPGEPGIVGSYFGGTPSQGGQHLHDVHVRDGLAFLSHWNAGLIILDVGNGIAGGSPTNPVEVGRVMPREHPGNEEPAGQIHNAWYWPETGYVFIGEEDFDAPGRMHVVDAGDLSSPRHVASYRPLPHRDTPHFFWLDEGRGILHMAWYTQGLRALDVTGELLGDLELQGREVASIVYDGEGTCFSAPPGGTCTWAAHLHRGLVFVSDMNSGIWALRPEF